ncbi:MAG: DMT family transporter [Deltaproteobacteria bacterium]|nr:DMT family transporter [Deltaproteobacteria bacterium]
MNSSHANRRQVRNFSWRPYLLLAIAPLCWAGNIVLARGVIDLIPPVTLAFWRWTVASLLLWPFASSRAREDWPLFTRHWKIMVFLSLVGISGFNTLLYVAVHTTTAINGALIQTTMPAVIIIISLLAFNEKVTRLQSLGVALCILGAGLVVLRGRLSTILDMSFVQGDLLMLAAVLLYALYSAFLQRRPPIHPLSFLLYTFALGALGLLPLYLLELMNRPPFVLNIEVVASVLYVAAFPSIVAFFCWNRGVEQIGANRAGLFINFIPVFASIMAIIWLGESLRAFHLIGMLLIFGGMVLFNRY